MGYRPGPPPPFSTGLDGLPLRLPVAWMAEDNPGRQHRRGICAACGMEDDLLPGWRCCFWCRELSAVARAKPARR